MDFDMNNLVRLHLFEFIKNYKKNATTEAGIRLNKNENSLGSPLKKWYNRYPNEDPLKLKQEIATLKNTNINTIFLANGTNECLDNLFKCFCEPNKDNIIICPPTYDNYAIYAAIHNIEIREANLLENFQLDLFTIENLVDENTKIILLCSPNNPTGNSLNVNDIEFLLNNFNGIVVVDEAYINFSKQKSLIPLLKEYPNLVILQTFSIAWGLAGLRLAMAFANHSIIQILNCINSSYNISTITQEIAIEALKEIGQVNDMIKLLVEMRIALTDVFKQIPFILKVHESDTNFILIEVMDANHLCEYLHTKNIFVSNVSHLPLCKNCIRITIGTEQENTILIDAFAEYLDLNFE
jgi:histidinol-phosphate aminotransferase